MGLGQIFKIMRSSGVCLYAEGMEEGESPYRESKGSKAQE